MIFFSLQGVRPALGWLMSGRGLFLVMYTVDVFQVSECDSFCVYGGNDTLLVCVPLSMTVLSAQCLAPTRWCIVNYTIKSVVTSFLLNAWNHLSSVTGSSNISRKKGESPRMACTLTTAYRKNVRSALHAADMARATSESPAPPQQHKAAASRRHSYSSQTIDGRCVWVAVCSSSILCLAWQ